MHKRVGHCKSTRRLSRLGTHNSWQNRKIVHSSDSQKRCPQSFDGIVWARTLKLTSILQLPSIVFDILENFINPKPRLHVNLNPLYSIV